MPHQYQTKDLSVSCLSYPRSQKRSCLTGFTTLFNPSNMFGFLRRNSCCTALVKVVDDWSQWLQIPKRLLAPLQLTYPKLLIPCVKIFLQSYVLMALVRRQLPFLHLNLSGRKQKVKLTEVCQIGYRCTVQCVSRQPPGAPSD